MCQARNDSALSLLGGKLVLKRWRTAPACYDRPAYDVRQRQPWVTLGFGALAPALQVATVDRCASSRRDNYGNGWRNSTLGAQENCGWPYISRQPLPPSLPLRLSAALALLAWIADLFL